MSNHITIELCEADRARIDRLIHLGESVIDRLPERIGISAPDQTKLLTVSASVGNLLL